MTSRHILFFLSIICLYSCSPKRTAVDLIVHNAVVYTVDGTFSTAQAFAVKDGKFVAVGTNDEIMSRYGDKATKIIDAQGKPVYPGFF